MPLPWRFEDVRRLEQIRFRAKQLKDEVVVDASGNPRPSRPILKSAAERLVYEDLDWLLNRIKENWEA